MPRANRHIFSGAGLASGTPLPPPVPRWAGGAQRRSQQLSTARVDIEDEQSQNAAPSAWRRLWWEFITSGGRTTPDDPDYLRITVLNLVEGAALFVWTLFLCLNLLEVFASSPARLLIDITGIAVAVGVLVSLRAGAPVAIVAEVVHAFLFLLLLGVAIARTDNPLAITIPLIYPAVAFLLLDNVLRACLWTLVMIVCLNVTIFVGFGPHMSDRGAVVDGALSVSVAMFFQAAVMALYIHNRKHVMTRLRSLGTELTYIAAHDALTGLYNRRTFRETVDRELARRDRDPRLFALLLFDIDRFKAYNDRFGHPQGDRLIQRVAATAQSVFSRREDLIFRLGGEEFGAVYRAENESDGAAMADRLLAAVEDLGEPAPAGPHESITVSAGLLLADADVSLTADEAYRHADEALYRAKDMGRASWVRADLEPVGTQAAQGE